MTSSAKTHIVVEIPSGIEIKLEDPMLTVTGPKGTISREMTYPDVEISIKEETVSISGKRDKKGINAIVGTFTAHINNMITGVTKEFEYKLKVVYSHFPMTVKQSGNMITVDNYFGEKTPRRSVILGNCNISIKGDTVTVRGINIEEVAQTAANIEKATRVKKRDRRVFQDGIYLVEKGVVSSE